MRVRVEVVAPDRSGAYKVKGYASRHSAPDVGKVLHLQRPDPSMRVKVIERNDGCSDSRYHTRVRCAGSVQDVAELQQAEGWTAFTAETEKDDG